MVMKPCCVLIRKLDDDEKKSAAQQNSTKIYSQSKKRMINPSIESSPSASASSPHRSRPPNSKSIPPATSASPTIIHHHHIHHVKDDSLPLSFNNLNLDTSPNRKHAHSHPSPVNHRRTASSNSQRNRRETIPPENGLQGYNLEKRRKNKKKKRRRRRSSENIKEEIYSNRHRSNSEDLYLPIRLVNGIVQFGNKIQRDIDAVRTGVTDRINQQKKQAITTGINMLRDIDDNVKKNFFGFDFFPFSHAQNVLEEMLKERDYLEHDSECSSSSDDDEESESEEDDEIQEEQYMRMHPQIDHEYIMKRIRGREKRRREREKRRRERDKRRRQRKHHPTTVNIVQLGVEQPLIMSTTARGSTELSHSNTALTLKDTNTALTLNDTELSSSNTNTALTNTTHTALTLKDTDTHTALMIDDDVHPTLASVNGFIKDLVGISLEIGSSTGPKDLLSKVVHMVSVSHLTKDLHVSVRDFNSLLHNFNYLPVELASALELPTNYKFKYINIGAAGISSDTTQNQQMMYTSFFFKQSPQNFNVQTNRTRLLKERLEGAVRSSPALDSEVRLLLGDQPYADDDLEEDLEDLSEVETKEEWRINNWKMKQNRKVRDDVVAKLLAYHETEKSLVSFNVDKRIQAMMHYKIPLKPFYATVKVPNEERKWLDKNQDDGMGNKGIDLDDDLGDLNVSVTPLIQNYASHPSGTTSPNLINNGEFDGLSVEPSTRCSPASFPASPIARGKIMHKMSSFTDHVLYEAKQELSLLHVMDRQKSSGKKRERKKKRAREKERRKQYENERMKKEIETEQFANDAEGEGIWEQFN